MKTRFIAVVLVLVALLSLFASCNQEEKPGEPTPATQSSQPTDGINESMPMNNSEPVPTGYVWAAQALPIFEGEISYAVANGNAIYFISDSTLYKSDITAAEAQEVKGFSNINLDDFYYMTVDSENTIWLASRTIINAYSESGELLYEHELSEEDGYYGVSSIFPLSDGKIGALMYNLVSGRTSSMSADGKVSSGGTDGSTSAIVIDRNTDRFEPLGSGTLNIDYSSSVSGVNSNNEFVCYDYDTLYTIGFDENYDIIGAASPVLSWLDVNLASASLIGTPTDDTYVALNNGTLYSVSEIPAANVPQRTVLTIAASDMAMMSLRSAVADFNASDPNYKVEVVKYDDPLVLTTDVIAGNIPDMIAIIDVNFGAFAKRGLFEDLHPYIDSEPSMRLLPGIVKAYETNGKLYRISPMFELMTMIGSSDFVGENIGWTLEELMSYKDKAPNGGSVLPATWRKEDAMIFLVEQNLDEYIDWENGTADFDSEEFRTMLEFLDTFPDQSGRNSGMESLLSGDELTWQWYIQNIRQVANLDMDMGGKEVFKGFPNPDRTMGLITESGPAVAMTASSENKDGVWSFIRYLINQYSDEYGLGFPINADKFDDMIQDVMTDAINEAPYSDSYQEPIEPLSAEALEKFTTLVNNSNKMLSLDEQITQIIQEETAPFFAGQKTAAEACEIIQSRVSLYLGEQL